jgi:hypothetical protein
MHRHRDLLGLSSRGEHSSKTQTTRTVSPAPERFLDRATIPVEIPVRENGAAEAGDATSGGV